MKTNIKTKVVVILVLLINFINVIKSNGQVDETVIYTDKFESDRDNLIRVKVNRNKNIRLNIADALWPGCYDGTQKEVTNVKILRDQKVEVILHPPSPYEEDVVLSPSYYYDMNKKVLSVLFSKEEDYSKGQIKINFKQRDSYQVCTPYDPAFPNDPGECWTYKPCAPDYFHGYIHFDQIEPISLKKQLPNVICKDISDDYTGINLTTYIKRADNDRAPFNIDSYYFLYHNNGIIAKAGPLQNLEHYYLNVHDLPSNKYHLIAQQYFAFYKDSVVLDLGYFYLEGPPEINNSELPDKYICSGLSFDLKGNVSSINDIFSNTQVNNHFIWNYQKNSNSAVSEVSSGETESRTYLLHFDKVQSEKNGIYFLEARNTCGSITSRKITVQVHNSVSITTPPVSQTICSGTNTSLSVTARAGYGTLRYQWEYKTDNGNWSNIPSSVGTYWTGVTNSTLLINAIQENLPEAKYHYRVKVGDGCSTSNNVYVYNANDVQLQYPTTPPTITAQPSDITICAYGTTNLVVNAVSNYGLQYEWFRKLPNEVVFNSMKDLSNIEDVGFNSNTLTLKKFSIDKTQYYVKVKTVCISPRTSDSKYVTVSTYDNVKILKSPESVTTCIFSSPTFEVEAKAGYGKLSYQWQVRKRWMEDWVDISVNELYSGQNSNKLLLSRIGQNENGNYYQVRVSDECSPISGIAKVNENLVQLTIGSPVINIKNITKDTIICEGTNMELKATVSSGANSLIWQYSENVQGNGLFYGLDSETSNKAVLSLPNVSIKHTGLYRIKAFGNCGYEIEGDYIPLLVLPPSPLTIGDQLEICADADTYDLDKDKVPQDVKGVYTWLLDGFEFKTNLFNPKLHTSGNYIITFVPNDKKPRTCYKDVTRTVNLKSVGGKGSLSFLKNEETINTCIDGEQIVLTDIINDKGGTWKAIKGGGVSTSKGKTIYTPSNNDYTELDPNIYRYTTLENGCSVSIDLNVYVKNNLNKISLPIIEPVCPETTVSLEPTSSLPGQEKYLFYKNDNKIFEGKKYDYTVSENTKLQIKSLNNFGCISEPITVDISTVFGTGNVTISPYTAVLKQKVEFNYDGTNYDDGMLFEWNFNDETEPNFYDVVHISQYFYQPKTLNIDFIMKSPKGCTKTIPATLVISGKPWIPFPDWPNWPDAPINSGPLSIGVDNNSIVKPWPNPVATTLNFSSVISKCVVYDIAGRMMVKIDKGEIKQVDVSALLPGIYVVELESNSSKAVYKIVKN